MSDPVVETTTHDWIMARAEELKARGETAPRPARDPVNQPQIHTWVEAIGDGSTDFRAIGAALRDVNFSGHAIIELAHEKDFQPTRPLGDSFKRSREVVRTTLGF